MVDDDAEDVGTTNTRFQFIWGVCQHSYIASLIPDKSASSIKLLFLLQHVILCHCSMHVSRCSKGTGSGT